MAFGDFLKNIGQTFTPPERIRDWRKLKRQYRAYLRDDLGQDASAVRSGVREWMKNNPKPNRTRKEREKTLSDIPQLYREGQDLFGRNGSNGVNSLAFTGQTTTPRTAGLNPLFLLLLVPLVFPKQIKKFFNV